MSIQEQIEALTQELRPYPIDEKSYYYLGSDDQIYHIDCISIHFIPFWHNSLFSSTNKAEVVDFADCYRRLKLYQLLGKKSLMSGILQHGDLYGTDFVACANNDPTGRIVGRWRICVLGGVWFANESDRLEALKICQIDREFQNKCSKYNLGGA